MDRVLVTGGRGFIGTHLVRALGARGFEVVSYDLKDGQDIFDRPRLAEALQGVSLVFHLAAKVSVPESILDPISTHETNATGTVVVLEEARRAGVRRVVYSSSAAVYGAEPTLPKTETSIIAPLSPYGLSKYIGEEYCRLYYSAYGLETVILRYMNVVGRGQDPRGPYAAVIPLFIDRMKRGEPITIYGDGEQTRDFVSVDDVIAANCFAAKIPAVAGETFVIASGVEVTLNTLVTTIERVSGTPLQKHFAPPRSGDILRSVGGIQKAERMLGFKPQVSFEDAVRRIIQA